MVCNTFEHLESLGLVIFNGNNNLLEAENILEQINACKNIPGIFNTFAVVNGYVGLSFCSFDNKGVNVFVCRKVEFDMSGEACTAKTDKT